MAKASMDTLMTKISNVFKKDIFIYKYKYIFGGWYSEMENEAEFFCVLNPDYEAVIKEEYPGKEVIKITDVKKFKKEPEKFIELSFSKSVIEEQDRKMKYLENILSNKKNYKWEKLELSDADIMDIFFDRNLHIFFSDRDDIATLHVAKSIFPLLSEKNAGDTEIMFQSLGVTDGVSNVFFSYVTDWFQIYEDLRYVDIGTESI